MIPRAVSKSPQRVCDKCYPTCLRLAKGLVPPPRRDLPNDEQRQHTGETKDMQDKRQRMRNCGDHARIKLEGSGRDVRNWNGGNADKEQRRMERRNIEPQTTNPARAHRLRSPRTDISQSVRSPQGREMHEMLALCEKVSRDSARRGDMHSKDLLRTPRDKEQRSRIPREKVVRKREATERDPREKDQRMRDPRQRERRTRDPDDPSSRDRERRDKERRGRAMHERDLFDVVPRKKSSRDPSGQNVRRRTPSTERDRNRKVDHSLGSKKTAGRVRGETPLSSRTASPTLTAALLSNERRKPLSDARERRRKEEKETSNTFADSAFSIFSLAGSDPEESEKKARNDAEVKKKADRRLKTKVIKRDTMEKKEHLDFSASSSSVKSLDMSLITQKYLKPKPTSKQKSNLQPTIEESSDEESTKTGRSRRKGAPLAKKHNKSRGESPTGLPPFRKERAGNASFRDRDESEDKKFTAQNSFEMSISEYDEFEQTQLVLDSEKSFSESYGERKDREDGDENSASKLRAKKRAIAGIDTASLKAIEKTSAAAKYKLTQRDRMMMRQISELETVSLQYQKELVDLLDMYGEAVKRSRKAQRGLRKAKVRIARYEKAHAAISRAIRTGKLYMKQKEYMAAILELTRAAEIEPSNATLWYLLAECRLLVGQSAAAEKACMTCLKLRPTGVGVAMLGRILQERGQHDEAIDCYLSALGRNDESEDEQDSL